MKYELKYKILWIDDEHEELKSLIGQAKAKEIELVPFKSFNRGIEELEKNYLFYDAVLLDAKIFENENDIKGSEDTEFSIRAKEKILKLPKAFEIFVLTGQSEVYTDNTYKKVFKKVYRKAIASDINRLFTDLTESAQKQTDTQIRLEFIDIFKLCNENYLGKELSGIILRIIKESKNPAEIYQNRYNDLRKIIESLYKVLNKHSLIPDEVFNSKNWISQCTYFLNGTHEEFKIHENAIHPAISYSLKQLVNITQDASHGISEKLRLDINGLYTINKTPYLFLSALYALFEILIYFHKSFIINFDNGQNQKLYYKIKTPYIGQISTDADGFYYCGEYFLNQSFVKDKYKTGDKIKILDFCENTDIRTKSKYTLFANKFEKITDK